MAAVEGPATMDVSLWDEAKLRAFIFAPQHAMTAQLAETANAPTSPDSSLAGALALLQCWETQVTICYACFQRHSAAAGLGALVCINPLPVAAELVSTVVVRWRDVEHASFSTVSKAVQVQLESSLGDWLAASQGRLWGRREIQDATSRSSGPRCRLCAPVSRCLLQADTAAVESPLLHLTLQLTLQPPTVWYETVDPVREAEGFAVVCGHWQRMWNARPAHLFHRRGELLTAAADVRLLNAPQVVWVLRVHNDHCHRQYLQQLAATANRRRQAVTDSASSSWSVADAGNEQRCFRGEVWRCGGRYSADRIGSSFVSCSSSECSLCCVTGGSLNLDRTMTRGRQGRGHYLSAHSSRAHCYSQTTQPQSLYAAVMVRAALGDIFTPDKHGAQDLTQLTAAPAGYDSVLANGSATGDHPMADPAVVLYDPKALFASYVIIYAV
jgi:hypothetical protein